MTVHVWGTPEFHKKPDKLLLCIANVPMPNEMLTFSKIKMMFQEQTIWEGPQGEAVQPEVGASLPA